MANPWCRLHSEMLNDPKVQTLPDASFKAWVNSMMLATSRGKGGELGTLHDVSFAFRETQEGVSSAFHPLIERGLIVTDGETFHIAKWDKRQYKSDTSTDRVRRHRNAKRNVTETPPDTDTDTDIKKEPIGSQKRSAPKASTSLPDNWTPSKKDIDFAVSKGFTESEIADQADRFRDYWIAKRGTKDGRRSDWSATWRNWIRNAIDRRQSKAGGHLAGRPQAQGRRTGDGLVGAVIRDQIG